MWSGRGTCVVIDSNAIGLSTCARPGMRRGVRRGGVLYRNNGGWRIMCKVAEVPRSGIWVSAERTGYRHYAPSPSRKKVHSGDVPA